ncbi:Lsr2 family protein [Streptomyces cocklensis]|uniref:Lsr2 protein n=1 Tax=Actinacidiphila cocklensis TaxID=887465 RepID=A0A9W4DMN7_9ACTN|nr:histone-like nucleoid-structuring protein Lsr2 [Actinacidiphila cocklensis]MDD1057906.1 Lsr2 family protein [Actinacidiphila cocklensis]CAG6392770.1 putative Lsr2 protein [Actinacidiphila cocklensis]
MSEGTIFVATDSIHGEFEGRPLYLHQGVTTARDGHPVLAAFPGHFVPLRPTFEVEDEPEKEAETTTPADTTPQASARADPAAAPAPKDVRAWAAEQGIDAPARGKLPDALVEQYQAAQQGA